MRRHVLIALGLLLVGGTAEASSTGHAMGMFTTSGALPQVKSDAQLEVHGPYADVSITQTYRNDSDRGVEAVYVFPLPGDAAVRSMEITTGDETITAKIAKRDDARASYEAAVAAGTTAAMTEEERADVFTQQVTGIAAHAEVTVTLRFDMAIGRTATGWELVLPLVVAPRHVAGTANGLPTKGTGSAPDTDKVGDASRVTPPVRGDKQGNPISIKIDLGDVDKANVDVPSHEATVGTRKGHTIVTVEDARSDRDLVVRWAGAKKAAASAFQDTGAVALMVEAPAPTTTAHRRWVIAIDTSGSIDGDALLIVREGARALVDKLGDDPIAIVDAAGSSTPSWRQGDQGREDTKDAIDELSASGGEDLGELIASAFATADAAGEGDEVEVVLFTDGLVADDAAVAARADGFHRLHVIGVGAAPNRWLLDALATRGRGAEIVLGTGDDVDTAIGSLVASAAAPALVPTVDWGHVKVHDVAPATLPALAAGRVLVITGRLDRPGAGVITVRLGKAKLRAKLANDDAGLVSRRWARTRVEDLIATGGDAATITQLGVDHELVTPYTALVAIGSRVVVDGGVSTTIAVPVAMPAGMRWQAVFGAGGDAKVTIDTTTTTGENEQGLDDDRDHQPDHAGHHQHEGGDKTETSSAGGESRDTSTPQPEEPVNVTGAAPTIDEGSYDYDEETIEINGDVVQTHKWSGSLSLTTGVHARDGEVGPEAALAAGAYRAIARHFAIGLAGKLQDAPLAAGGVDLDAYLMTRVILPHTPALFELGLGAALDEPGFAWRVGVRIGRGHFAPVVEVDQSYGGGAKTTGGLGLDWTF